MKIREYAAGIAEGTISCRQLTEACLMAIAENDQDGRKLNSVAEINADALFEAEAIDREIREKGPRGPLHGIPVLLKDNIDAKGLHTTAGSFALADLYPENDAAVTEKLRAAGALILGKANLSEFAYFMSRRNMPSGYSSLHGQVVHAFVPGFDPSGSSSGSAVAVSARFVPYAIGTETDGSLMSPAAANAVVAIKPTVGLVSRRGILPISNMQDTAGPMTTSVEDAAVVLSAVAGQDPADPATLRGEAKDYAAALKADLTGLTVGIYPNGNSKKADNVLKKAEKILRDAGAKVVEAVPEKLFVPDGPALIYEFKQGLNRYLSEHSSRCRDLMDIIHYNRAHPQRCLKYGQTVLFASQATEGFLTESDYIRHRLQIVKEARELMEHAMEKAGADCLLSAGSRPRGNLAPVSGNPCMSVPAVRPDPKDYRPVSFYLSGRAFDEATLIRAAYVLEKGIAVRTCPSWAKDPILS